MTVVTLLWDGFLYGRTFSSMFYNLGSWLDIFLIILSNIQQLYFLPPGRSGPDVGTLGVFRAPTNGLPCSHIWRRQPRWGALLADGKASRSERCSRSSWLHLCTDMPASLFSSFCHHLNSHGQAPLWKTARWGVANVPWCPPTRFCPTLDQPLSNLHFFFFWTKKHLLCKVIVLFKNV